MIEPAAYGVEHFMRIGIIACQCGVLIALLSIRHRFYCAAEFYLIVLGLAAIACGSVFENSGHAATLMRLIGWLSYLVGILIQFFMPKREQ